METYTGLPMSRFQRLVRVVKNRGGEGPGGEGPVGGTGAAELMEVVALLKRVNQSGGRKVPEGAPTAFVPARYAEYLAKARKDGDETAYRHYWELRVVLALRDGLRSGDVFVPARAATLIRPPTCTRPSSGRRGVPISAGWSASPVMPPRRSNRVRTNCSPHWPTGAGPGVA
ncbi:hypothetical protein [Nonomuraea sp. NPDC003214]